MEKQFFQSLISKYLDGTATEEERSVVETYYEQLSEEQNDSLSPEKIVQLKAQIFQKLRPLLKPPKVVPIWRSFRFRMAAAAILVLFAAGAFYYSLHQSLPMEGSAVITKLSRFKNDIAPAHYGATLTLSNHAVIQLDSAGNGALAVQGSVQIKKQESVLSYSGNSQGNVISYNTLSTGKGETYQVRLADGTKVWLDALSSIRYPTAFTGSAREVAITGQVYFEVAKNTHQPFRVKTGTQTVEVLGTHFNINAFEPVVKTTLLEGSVKVTANGKAQTLKPGQQSTWNPSTGMLSTVNDPDMEQTMAWKNGLFRFNGATVQEIMAQLARWYDIEVVYQDPVAETFVAKIPRDEPVSHLLQLLEMTHQVAFGIDGKKITVSNVKDKKMKN